MKTEKNMLIPVNVKTRTEFFQGFGIKELINACIGGIVGIIIGLLINSIFHNIFISIFIVFVTIAITIIFSIKDKNNQSVYSHSKDLIYFLKSQKNYEYVRKEKWHDI